MLNTNKMLIEQTSRREADVKDVTWTRSLTHFEQQFIILNALVNTVCVNFGHIAQNHYFDVW